MSDDKPFVVVTKYEPDAFEEALNAYSAKGYVLAHTSVVQQNGRTQLTYTAVVEKAVEMDYSKPRT